MKCPKCGEKTRVADSRSDGGVVHRKRRCGNCGEVFYTAESRAESAEAFRKTYQRYKNWMKYYSGR